MSYSPGGRRNCTFPAASVSPAAAQIISRHLTETSLMPAGLLDKLSDREIIDLYAYLKTLGASAKN